MRLSQEQQKELETQVINHPDVKPILKAAQICLYYEHINIHTLSGKTANKIRRLGLSISPLIRDNLENIIEQMLTAINCQVEESANDLAFLLVAKYRDRLDSKQELSDATISTELSTLILENLITIGVKKATDSPKSITTKKSTGITQVLQTHQQVIGYSAKYSHRVFQFIILLIFLYIQWGLFQQSKNNNSQKDILLKSMAVFLLAGVGYFITDLLCKTPIVKGFFLTDGIEDLVDQLPSKKTPQYDFCQVEVVDAKTYQPIEITYAVDFHAPIIPPSAPVEPPTIPEKKPDTSKEPVSREPASHQSSRAEPSSADPIPRPIPEEFNLTWSSDKVLFGEQKGVITRKDVSPMSSRFFSKKLQYWAFFNTKALQEQKLAPTDAEWTNYQAEIKDGMVVPPTHNDGIKQLKPRIMSDLTINKNSFGNQLFSFSVKIVGEKYRLLGRVCATQTGANGIQNQLVDFCWHWPKGPGKR